MLVFRPVYGFPELPRRSFAFPRFPISDKHLRVETWVSRPLQQQRRNIMTSPSFTLVEIKDALLDATPRTRAALTAVRRRRGVAAVRALLQTIAALRRKLLSWHAKRVMTCCPSCLSRFTIVLPTQGFGHDIIGPGSNARMEAQRNLDLARAAVALAVLDLGPVHPVLPTVGLSSGSRTLH